MNSEVFYSVVGSKILQSVFFFLHRKSCILNPFWFVLHPVYPVYRGRQKLLHSVLCLVSCILKGPRFVNNVVNSGCAPMYGKCRLLKTSYDVSDYRGESGGFIFLYQETTFSVKSSSFNNLGVDRNEMDKGHL